MVTGLILDDMQRLKSHFALSVTAAVSISYNDVPGRYAYTDLDCRNARADSLAQCGDFSEDIQVHDTCTIAGGVICEGN